MSVIVLIGIDGIGCFGIIRNYRIMGSQIKSKYTSGHPQADGRRETFSVDLVSRGFQKRHPLFIPPPSRTEYQGTGLSQCTGVGLKSPPTLHVQPFVLYGPFVTRRDGITDRTKVLKDTKGR